MLMHLKNERNKIPEETWAFSMTDVETKLIPSIKGDDYIFLFSTYFPILHRSLKDLATFIYVFDAQSLDF